MWWCMSEVLTLWKSEAVEWTYEFKAGLCSIVRRLFQKREESQQWPDYGDGVQTQKNIFHNHKRRTWERMPLPNTIPTPLPKGTGNGIIS